MTGVAECDKHAGAGHVSVQIGFIDASHSCSQLVRVRARLRYEDHSKFFLRVHNMKLYNVNCDSK